MMMMVVMMLLMMMMKQRDDALNQTMGLKIFNPKVCTNYGVQPKSLVQWCITWGIRPTYGVENFQPKSLVQWYITWGIRPNCGVENFKVQPASLVNPIVQSNKASIDGHG